MELERIIETLVVLTPEARPEPPEPPQDVLREPTSKADFQIGTLVRHRLRPIVMIVSHLCEDEKYFPSPEYAEHVGVRWPCNDREFYCRTYHWRELVIIDKSCAP